MRITKCGYLQLCGQHLGLASSHGTAFPDGEQVEVRSCLPVALPEKQRQQVRNNKENQEKLVLDRFVQ